jgi:hypothetical protein
LAAAQIDKLLRLNLLLLQTERKQKNLLPLKNLVSTAVASYRADHPAVLDDRPAKVTPLPAGASRHAKSAARSGRAFCNKKRGEEKMKKRK